MTGGLPGDQLLGDTALPGVQSVNDIVCHDGTKLVRAGNGSMQLNAINPISMLYNDQIGLMSLHTAISSSKDEPYDGTIPVTVLSLMPQVSQPAKMRRLRRYTAEDYTAAKTFIDDGLPEEGLDIIVAHNVVYGADNVVNGPDNVVHTGD